MAELFGYPVVTNTSTPTPPEIQLGDFSDYQELTILRGSSVDMRAYAGVDNVTTLVMVDPTNYERHLLYLIDYLTKHDSNERGFLQALQSNPDDQALRGIYADYLREQGRDKTADLILTTDFVPGK